MPLNVSKATTTAGATLPELFESISDEIAFLTRSESPLLARLGFPGRVGNVGNVKHEWLQEALNPNSTNANGAHSAVATTINVTAGTGSSRFTVGMVVQVDGSRELMRITSVAANSFDVTRAFNGTTGEAIADGAVITRVADPAEECEDVPGDRPTVRVRRENFTQIFRMPISVCRSMMKSNVIGVADEFEHQLLMAQRDLIRDLAMSVINGRRRAANPEGSGGTERMMDGIIQTILNGADPVVIDAGGATLDELILNDALKDLFVNGSMPTVLAAPPTQRRQISSLIEGRQRYEPDSDMLGAVVNRFMSDFADLEILQPDIFIPSDAVLLLDPNRIEIKKLGDDADVWELIEIGRPGLAQKAELVGEFTAELKNCDDGGHALIHNLAFTP